MRHQLRSVYNDGHSGNGGANNLGRERDTSSHEKLPSELTPRCHVHVWLQHQSPSSVHNSVAGVQDAKFTDVLNLCRVLIVHSALLSATTVHVSRPQHASSHVRPLPCYNLFRLCFAHQPPDAHPIILERQIPVPELPSQCIPLSVSHIWPSELRFLLFIQTLPHAVTIVCDMFGTVVQGSAREQGLMWCDVQGWGWSLTITFQASKFDPVELDCGRRG